MSRAGLSGLAVCCGGRQREMEAVGNGMDVLDHRQLLVQIDLGTQPGGGFEHDRWHFAGHGPGADCKMPAILGTGFQVGGLQRDGVRARGVHAGMAGQSRFIGLQVQQRVAQAKGSQGRVAAAFGRQRRLVVVGHLENRWAGFFEGGIRLGRGAVNLQIGLSHGQQQWLEIAMALVLMATRRLGEGDAEERGVRPEGDGRAAPGLPS